jgi:translocation and assembly module TamA
LLSNLYHHPPSGFLFWRKKAHLDRLSLELDRKRVESFYHWHGYFRARVRDVSVEVEPDRDEARITFDVAPGPPSLLVDLDVRGTPAGFDHDEPRLLRQSRLAVGDLVDYGAYEKLVQRLRGRLIARGYAHAEVSGSVEVLDDAPSARIILLASPGPMTYFGEVELDPPPPVPASAVYNRIAWDEGDRFDPDDIELTEGRLYQLGMVGSVQFDWPSDVSTSTLPITISTRPATPRQLKLGGGVARDLVNWEVRLRGSYRHAGFLHPLNSLRLDLSPAFIFRQDLGQPGFNIEALAELARADFLFPRVTGTGAVAYRLTQYEAFQTTGPRVSGSVNRPFIRDRLRLSLSASFDHVWVSFDDVRDSLTEAEERQFGLFPTLPIFFVVPSIAYDARDNPRQPTRGWFARLGFTVGYVGARSSSIYTILRPELRGYYPLGDRVVLAARTRLAASAFGTGPIPAPERLFSGGAQNQRGFANRRLAPSVENSDGEIVPLGGEALVEVSGEVRVHLFELFSLPFGVVAFGDGADVQQELSELRFPDMHWAVGGGLRLSTPVGPIRFDLGYRVTRQDEILPTRGLWNRFAWHLTIGEAF